jgi:hypothetical protein
MGGVGREQVVPTWQLSDGKLTAALLSTHTTLNQTYGRMLDLVADADGRGLAASKGYRNTTHAMSYKHAA